MEFQKRLCQHIATVADEASGSFVPWIKPQLSRSLFKLKVGRKPLSLRLSHQHDGCRTLSTCGGRSHRNHHC
jgi:hypothetical protein